MASLSSCSNKGVPPPGQLKPNLVRTWNLCPGWAMQLPPSQLLVQPMVKLSTYPRDRHVITDVDTHTEAHRTPTWLVTQAATDKSLPSTAPTDRTHIKHKHKQASCLLLLGWQRQKIISVAHTRWSSGSQAHAHLQIADYTLLGPFDHWLVQLDAH